MKWRIWLLSIGITVASILIFGFAATQVYYKSSIDDSKKYLRVYMNAFDASYSFDALGAKALSQKLGGARVTFMDGQGKVLGDSSADGENMENHASREEISAAIFEDEGFAVRGSSTLGKNMVYYCKKTENGNLVRIAVFADSDWTIFLSTLPVLLQFTGIVVLLSVALAFVATHFILGPVRSLAEEAADNMTVTSKYPELEPIAGLLNERNRNIRKQMDEIKAEKELVDRARKSKDEFISNITHEMNTPLTSIHGYAELLAAGGMKKEQQTTAYKTILSQSERLTNLISCIIGYSEIESDDLPAYEVDFSALARELLCAVKPEANKRGITITENIDDNVIVLSRQERLNAVFGNLVRNAIRYNKDGGNISVTLSRNGLVVEDTGIGIADENKDKVFSRFFTVDKAHNGKNGGFGLGLAVVKRICQKSGWKLSFDSTLNVGSKFMINF